MGKNLHGGSKHKRKKNSTTQKKRDLPLAEPGCDYAKVTKMLGNKRLNAICYRDGKERMCKIRKAIKRNQWISVDNIILVGLRDFQDSKADVLLKYTDDEVVKLRHLKEIPNDKIGDGKDDEMFTFEAEEFDFDKL